MSDETPVRPELELLNDLLALDLSVVESKRTEFEGTVHMKMVLRDDPDILASCSFALIYGARRALLCRRPTAWPLWD